MKEWRVMINDKTHDDLRLAIAKIHCDTKKEFLEKIAMHNKQIVILINKLEEPTKYDGIGE